MKKAIAEPTQLLRGISHKEMINVMHMHDVLCSVDKFTRILQWVQQRTLEWAAEEEQRAVAEMEAELYASPDPILRDTCGCQTCRPITMTDMRMVVCSTCGNKRCPHATDHRLACTNSNEPGQPGSAYEHRLQPTE
jgi:hypothetical protein